MGTVALQLRSTECPDRIWDESLAYIKTIVDTTPDPFLILDEQLRVLAANKSFYKMVHLDGNDGEPKYINELGNGIWNIHTLGALLSGILPKKTFLKGIEVSSQFPSLGKKIIILNGPCKDAHTGISGLFSPLILLTLENSPQMAIIIAELADYAFRVRMRMYARTEQLEEKVGRLKKDVIDMKKNIRIRYK